MAASPVTTLIPDLNLTRDRPWRMALAGLFILALVCRFVVFMDISSQPVGHLEEWAGSEPWLFWQIGQRAAVDGNWLLRGTNILVSPEMMGLAPRLDWAGWGEGRLPRGSLAVYLMAISYSLTSSLALYRFLALLGGALAAPLLAVVGLRLFGCRRAALAAGIVAASSQPLVELSIIPGPWIWELLLILLAVLGFLRIRDDASNPAEWALLGIVAGLGLWMRPLFLWVPVLVPLACWAWRIRPSPASVGALAIPLLLFAGGLAARNAASFAAPFTPPGFAAWDFVHSTNPAAVRGEVLPPDVDVLQTTQAQALPAIAATLGRRDVRAVLPAIVSHKLRELLGARDTPASFNMHYIRRRAETLRVMTFPPDATMAAGWAALVFLLFLRRLPGPLVAMLAVALLDGIAFRSVGQERLAIHAVMILMIGGALVAAWDSRTSRPSLPFVFIALWAMFHAGLQIDDQARGLRFTEDDFQTSARMFLREGRRAEAERELEDWQQIQDYDDVFRSFWNKRR